MLVLSVGPAQRGFPPVPPKKSRCFDSLPFADFVFVKKKRNTLLVLKGIYFTTGHICSFFPGGEKANGRSGSPRKEPLSSEGSASGAGSWAGERCSGACRLMLDARWIRKELC